MGINRKGFRICKEQGERIMRGMLTKEINKIAVKMIGRKINQKELRLIPYIQYIMMNNQKLEINKINSEERDILKKWKEENFIEGGASGLSITKDFWNFMCEILFESYVKGGAEQ